MKRLVSTRGLSREKWLCYRKNGIGGSDAAAVCGMNPYSSPLQVYYDKTGKEIPGGDKESMRQGRDLEDYVARRFMEKTGLKVRRANAIYYDEHRPYMLADADRLVVGEKAGLECKTVSPYQADCWADGGVPLHYQIQCYHYMSVFGADKWYIAALVFGREFLIREITYDQEIIGNIRQMEQVFWQDHVQKRILPEPDGSESADRLLLERFQTAKTGKTVLLDGFREKIDRRQKLVRMIDAMKTEQKQIEQELRLYLGDAEYAEGEGYQVWWKNVVSNRLDNEKLKKEKPDIYAEYLRQQNTRRLTIKAA